MLQKFLRIFRSQPQDDHPYSYIRPATENDLDFIVELVRDGAQEQHFHRGLTTDYGCAMLWCALQHLILTGYYLRTTNEGDIQQCKGVLEVMVTDDQLVGFHLLVEETPGSIESVIEYYMVAIVPEHRRKGYAHTLLSHAEHTLIPATTTMKARCYQASEDMYQILIKAGFKHMETTLTGTRILYKSPN